MKEEFSAGGVIFKIDGDQLKVLLIKNAALRDPTKAYWGFPKGHLEKGESEQDAAVREVKEETGIDVEILERIDDEHYIFTHPQKGRISKKVTFFLMRYINGEPHAQLEELLDLGWFSPDDALEMLTFNTDKTILKKSLAKLNERE